MDKEQLEAFQNNLQASMLGKEVTSVDSDKDFKMAQWQLDMRREIEDLAHLWRGDVLEFVKTGTEGEEHLAWVNHDNYKQMNEKGVRALTSELWVLNRNVFMSNFNEKEIKTIMRWHMISLTNYLIMNMDDFDIDERNFSMLKEKIGICLYAALKRSQDAGERNALHKAMKSVEMFTNNLNPANQQSGLFGKIFRGGK